MDTPAKVILKSGKDQSLRRLHPWIFSGAIKKILGDPAEGDLVRVFDNKDEFLATGHYQNGSIAVRVVSFQDIPVDSRFWYERIKAAYDLRSRMGLIPSAQTNVYRLFHGEGDQLPGLIIDHYNGHLVMQLHSAGIYRNRHHVFDALKSLYGNSLISVFDKSSSTLPRKGPIEGKDEFLLGSESGATVQENGLSFRVDWVNGQKTGFFVDQRENRSLLQHHAKGKRVLNLFCYTGGFSVYALAGGAQWVHSVDSSSRAIELVDENVKLNFPSAPHEAFTDDAFGFLEAHGKEYDTIVLDPPAFAKHQNVLHNALQGYKRLNQAALERIQPGGILFTFSCSQVVSRENFRKSVFAAAANSRRNVRILHQLSQPADHPVSIYHPEGEYLKGLVLYVE